ncbi:MAG: L,D-transpeptidase family protein, partial [Bacteroidota bacterium]
TDVQAFYGRRGQEPAWLAPEARGVALSLLSRADRDALPIDSAWAGLSALSDTAQSAASVARLDVDLTAALVRFGHALAHPQADAQELYGIHWTPVPNDSAQVATMLAHALTPASTSSPLADALDAWADSLRPPHPGYHRLRQALAREMDLADIPTLDRTLALGDSSEAVAALRQRVAIEGLAPATESANRFDTPLAAALREVQRRLGLDASGVLDEPTRDTLNARRPDLIPLLALNLERWRWLPRDLGDLHLWINTPRYELALREREGDAWAEATRFVTVVGARDWQTPAFTDTLERVVFNPTWIVPPSIQRESYGEFRGFVERAPGPGNAMGRAKFLFPNDHAVYVHDTPTKWAFGVDDRARSHGCVRAGDPEGLARELLMRTNGWSASQVSDIFEGPWWPTQTVEVDRPVPVHITYMTAEVDPDGEMHVFEDVYYRDRRLADALGMAYATVPPTARASLLADRIGDEEEVAAEQEAAESIQSEPSPEPSPAPAGDSDSPDSTGTPLPPDTTLVRDIEALS